MVFEVVKSEEHVCIHFKKNLLGVVQCNHDAAGALHGKHDLTMECFNGMLKINVPTHSIFYFLFNSFGLLCMWKAYIR